jgi:dihydrodipicolinate synthase/N-acetylneuraminate lyase
VCGPEGSSSLLAALRRKDYERAEKLRAAFIPLEDLRDALSPIRVLHEAVRLAGIARPAPSSRCSPTSSPSTTSA